MGIVKEFTKGIWKENPVLVLLLGMCPVLACTSNAKNGLGLGLATTFVLIGSNFVISIIKKLIPKKVRIPCYIIVIGTFVTIVDLLMQAYAPPELNKALGIFIPLIVVNCIVLGRAEAFASKNSVIKSLADAIGMGVGFTLALVALGLAREFLMGGTIFTIKFIPGWTRDFMLTNFAPGAFIILGLFLAGMNYLNMKRARKKGKKNIVPLQLSCRSCNICKLSAED
ncbi:MAG: electron transport complex subunit E [bacterium]|nr:electron transport complex subunit E [bacterium]